MGVIRYRHCLTLLFYDNELMYVQRAKEEKGNIIDGREIIQLSIVIIIIIILKVRW